VRGSVICRDAPLKYPVYSDVEFIIPVASTRRHGLPQMGSEKPGGSRRIYANKKLLERCEYFRAMFRGGFREVEGDVEDVSSARTISYGCLIAAG
jgi:hypothetical protein